MIAVPVATPVTTPPVATVALAVLLLVHAPPVTVEDIVAVAPTVTPVAPDNVPADGSALMVAVVIDLHPAIVRVIFAVPALTPVSKPVDAPTVATAVLPLFHVAPVPLAVSVLVAPWQMLAGPDVILGDAFTVMAFVAMQPLPNA